MSLFILDDKIFFPSADNAEEDGLLAIGGDLSQERLLLAYANGIFPWYNKGELIMWWCPHPRFILLPDQLKVSKSMRTILNNGTFKFTLNKAFDEVINNCRIAKRKETEGSWISDEIINAYIKLFKNGFAVSAEAWNNGKLAGGLYGVILGKVFFGESMFSNENNASKFAFIKMVQYLQTRGVELIDCQVYTKHLESLGAKMISREKFLQQLNILIN